MSSSEATFFLVFSISFCISSSVDVLVTCLDPVVGIGQFISRDSFRYCVANCSVSPNPMLAM